MWFDNYLDRVLCCSHQLESLLGLVKAEAVRYHIDRAYPAGAYQLQRRGVVRGAAGIGSGERYIVAVEQLVDRHRARILALPAPGIP